MIAAGEFVSHADLRSIDECRLYRKASHTGGALAGDSTKQTRSCPAAGADDSAATLAADLAQTHVAPSKGGPAKGIAKRQPETFEQVLARVGRDAERAAQGRKPKTE